MTEGDLGFIRQKGAEYGNDDGFYGGLLGRHETDLGSR